MAKQVTMKGQPLTLTGQEIEPGDAAPDFEAVNTGLEPVTLADLKGKVLILSAVPSLDTSVCSLETKTFSEKAAKLGDDVQIVTISMDLPFAQQRWCGAEGVDNVLVLSDYQQASFGENYGVLIRELRLLARTVFVVDKNGTVRYKQLVEEVTEEPDYGAVLKAARELTA